MKVALFVKKPVVVEAVQWDGENWDEIKAFTETDVNTGLIGFITRGNNIRILQIKTTEGVMEAEPDDWIIRGTQGEFYPCKPAMFEDTYEPVED